MTQVAPMGRGEASRWARHRQLSVLVVTTVPLIASAAGWLIAVGIFWPPATGAPPESSRPWNETPWLLFVGGVGITGLLVIPVVTWAGLSTLRAWEARDSPILRRRATVAAWLAAARGTVVISFMIPIVVGTGNGSVDRAEASWLLALGWEAALTVGTGIRIARWHFREARSNFPGQTRPFR